MDITQKRNQEFTAAEKKARFRAKKAVEKLNIEAQGGEIAVSRAEIEKLKTESLQMKKLNRIVRSKKLTAEEKIEQLIKAGPLKRANAEGLLKPDYMGKLGFPSHMLTAKRKKIKFLEAKIKKLEAAAPPKKAEVKEAVTADLRQPDPALSAAQTKVEAARAALKQAETGAEDLTRARELVIHFSEARTKKLKQAEADLYRAGDDYVKAKQDISAAEELAAEQATAAEQRAVKTAAAKESKAAEQKAVTATKKAAENKIAKALETQKRRAGIIERKLRAKRASEIKAAVVSEMRAGKKEATTKRRAQLVEERETITADRRLDVEGTTISREFDFAKARTAKEKEIAGAIANARFTEKLHNMNPVYALRNELLKTFDDYGLPYVRNSADARKLLDEMRVVIDDIQPSTFAIVYGRDFGDAIAKAKKSFSVPQLEKSFEQYAIRDQGFARYMAETTENIRKVAVYGLLGGFGTFRYAGLNAFSAPFLMALTRGYFGAAKDLGAGLSYYARSILAKNSDIAFRDEAGKAWTFGDVRAAQGRHPMSASQTAAEMDTSNLRHLTDLMKSGQHLYKLSPLAARSYVGRFADYTDRVLRQAVFVSGLARGLGEARAAREGMDALFDYSRARAGAFDRAMGQMTLFWSFQSEALRATFDSLWRNPKELLNTYRVLRGQQERNDSLASGSNMDQARIFRKRIRGFDKQENIVSGFPIPALESFGMVAEGMSTVLSPIVYEDVSFMESATRQKDILIDKASFRPAMKFALQWINKRGRGLKEGWAVPAPYVSGMPDSIWPVYKKAFNIRAVKPHERRESRPSRDGEQWRFATKEDETAHLFFQTFLLAAGLQRRTADALKTSAILREPEQGRVPYPYGEKHSLMEAVMYEAGIITFLSHRDHLQKLEFEKSMRQSELRTRQ